MCEACDAAVAAEIARRAARDTAERLYQRLWLSGLPIDYRNGTRTLNDVPIHLADAISLCKLLGNELRGLYLCGPAGSYKTSLAAAYLAETISGQASRAFGAGRGRYVYVPDLISDIHATYNNASDDETRAAITWRLMAARWLVLDDLGKEKASEHAAGVILEILDGRYREWRSGMWMIITSNLDLNALCDRFPEEWGDPIRRRIAELTVSVPMERAI